MRCLVVYESIYGNTRDIALAIADGAATTIPTDAVEVADAPTTIPADVGLLIVGGPTHGFTMTRPGTRADAMTKHADGFEGSFVSTDSGIREWLGEVTVSKGTRFATFDTKIAKPHLPGSAAVKAARLLKRKRLVPVADPENFWVEGTHGPLTDGDLERAKQWGAMVATALD